MVNKVVIINYKVKVIIQEIQFIYLMIHKWMNKIYQKRLSKLQIKLKQVQVKIEHFKDKNMELKYVSKLNYLQMRL